MIKLEAKTLLLGGLALVILLGANLFVTTHSAPAGEAKKTGSAYYNLNLSFTDNLLMFKGKYVNITLSSGKTMSGKIKDVRNGRLHLEKLKQKDFFDALILVDDISAMDAQFRGF